MLCIVRRSLAFFLVLLSLSIGTINVAWGATEIDIKKIQQDLIGGWIVEIVGEKRTRTLTIRGAEKKQDGAWLLDALYGWSDGGQSAVKAEILAKPDGYKLELTTQAASVLVAESTSIDSFSGTFTWRSGSVRSVKLDRTSDEALQKRAAELTASLQQAAIKAPGQDVPAMCAGFHGGWTGRWGYGVGEEWLWVAQVDADCVARYRFGRTGYNGPFGTAQIRNGVLSTPCAQGGTCSFERHGDDLWGRWSGGSGTNPITLRKVQIEAK